MPSSPPLLQQLLAEEPFVRALARTLVADEADDVVQQTWLRALEQQPGTAIHKPRQWLGRIVRNLAADTRRRQQRRRAREDVVRGEDRVPSSSQLLEGEELRRAMVVAVDNLPPAQRTVVLMRYYDGLPPRQIAAELGVPPSKVWSRLHAGLATLRARLDDRTAGDRRAWALPLIPFAARPRSLPFGETLAATPALGAIAMTMTMKSKVVAAAIALLAASVVWGAWSRADSPRRDVAVAAGVEGADAATGTMLAPPGSIPAIVDPLQRESAIGEPVLARPLTGILVVRVRYPDAPHTAAGLTVIVGREGEDPRTTTVRGSSDADGVATFAGLQPGKMTVRTALRADLSTVAVIEAGETTECTLELGGGGTLNGIVVDGAGLAVGGAVIEVALPGIRGVDAEPAALTAADGTFSIRQSGPTILVGARAAHLAASKLHLIRSQPGSVQHVRIELVTIGGSLEGVVVGPDGAPVNGAVVRVGEGRAIDAVTAPLPAQVYTDEAGRFRAIGIPIGEQPLLARARALPPWSGRCLIPGRWLGVRAHSARCRCELSRYRA